jgi:uncharacterized protein YjbI with pentapeptide repeats
LGADLLQANIQGAIIHGVDFRYTRLTGINFMETANGNDFRHSEQFYETNLNHTRSRGCNLSGLDLQYADLTYAMLDAANLQGAHLQNVYLSNASLRNTNMRGVDLINAQFEGVDRTGADVRFFAANRGEQQDA